MHPKLENSTACFKSMPIFIALLQPLSLFGGFGCGANLRLAGHFGGLLADSFDDYDGASLVSVRYIKFNVEGKSDLLCGVCSTFFQRRV